MALQTAMDEVKSIVASRGDNDHVSASRLQSHADSLEEKLEALLATGFPNGDSAIADTKRLVKTLGEMRIKVLQRRCPMQYAVALNDICLCFIVLTGPFI